MLDIASCIDAYMHRCANKRLSPFTLRHYKYQLDRLRILLLEGVDLGIYLQSKAVASHRALLVLWRHFAMHSCQDLEDKIKELELPRIKLRPPKFLNQYESQKLREAPIESLEDKCAILLMLDMGMRVGEVSKIKGEDLKDGWISIERKGGNRQRLPVPPNILAILQSIDRKDNEKVFKIATRFLQDKVKRYSQKYIGRSISPHTLRHTFATHAMANGGGIHVLKEFLGHANISSTNRYCHVIPEDLISLQALAVKSRLGVWVSQSESSESNPNQGVGITIGVE